MSAALCLVAIEEAGLRTTVASRLWALGFEVRQVSSEDMALRLLRRGRPVELAVAENRGIVARARLEGIATPFLLVTEEDCESLGEAALGGVRSVERPLDDAALGEVVAELIGAR